MSVDGQLTGHNNLSRGDLAGVQQFFPRRAREDATVCPGATRSHRRPEATAAAGVARVCMAISEAIFVSTRVVVQEAALRLLRAELSLLSLRSTRPSRCV